MASLCKLDADGQSFFLFTRINGGETGATSFDLVLTDAINAWSGTISEGDLKALSRKIGEGLDKFTEEAKKALTKTGVGSAIFEYQVSSKKDGCRELAWKRVMSDENIKFQLGSVLLGLADDPSVYAKAIFEYSMDEISTSGKKILRLERELERLSNERGQALKRLEKCVEMKEQLDKDLYSKFCVVLNEKKHKIRELRENREVAGTDTSEPEPASVKTENNDVQPNREEDDVSTDEEKEVFKQAKRTKKNSPMEDVDASLTLEEEEPTTSYGKRRRRKPNEKPTATSGKPSIPRVPSTPKNRDTSTSVPRSGRTASLRKTPSSTRKGRSADLDASQLFDEM